MHPERSYRAFSCPAHIGRNGSENVPAAMGGQLEMCRDTGSRTARDVTRAPARDSLLLGVLGRLCHPPQARPVPTPYPCFFFACDAAFCSRKCLRNHLHQVHASRSDDPSCIGLDSSGHAQLARRLTPGPTDSLESLKVLSGQEVAGVLVAAGFTRTLELGIVRGLTADFLLSLPAGRADRLRQRLQGAVPLSLEALAAVLQEGSDQSLAIARSIRALAGRAGVTQLLAEHQALLDELASLLLPLVGRDDRLLAMVLTRERHERVAAGEVSSAHQDDISTLTAVTCHPVSCCKGAAAPELDGREWMELLARAGTPAQTLRELGGLWQVPLPASFKSWDDYSHSCYALEAISDEVLRWHRQKPEAPVPLGHVWPLVRNFVHQAFFALALGDDTELGTLLSLVAPRRTGGVLGLLGQAKASGGTGLSWQWLMRLARCRLVEPVFSGKLSAATQAVETFSRPVCPSDLVIMVNSQNALCEAFEMAASLGMGVDYTVLLEGMPPRLAVQTTALCIWVYISNFPFALETGHLVQVFRQLGKQDLVRRLTGDDVSDFAPTVALNEVYCRASQFVSLADDIRRNPVAMLKFMARNNLVLHEGYCAPRHTGLAVRLLNSLALDASLLEMFQSFMQECRAASPTLPAEMETSNSGFPCDYACPVTLDYMREPVPTLGRGECVIYFEKTALLQALQQHPFHPVTKDPLSPDDVQGLDVDLAHLRRIHQWRREHPELEPGGIAFEPSDVG